MGWAGVHRFPYGAPVEMNLVVGHACGVEHGRNLKPSSWDPLFFSI